MGTVEISGIKGWSQVCDEGWDETDATVLCRELGYMYGFAITNAELSNGDVATFTDAFWKFNCTGNETTLANCTKGDHWQGHCTNGHLAAAVCHNKHKDKVNKSKCIHLETMFQSSVKEYTHVPVAKFMYIFESWKLRQWRIKCDKILLVWLAREQNIG